MKPSSLKGRSPWKVKKARGTVAGGIVIPNGAILVNQGLRKVKLEEDFVDLKPEIPVSMEIDQDLNSGVTRDVVSGGEAFTEEHQVTKVEVEVPNLPMSSEETPAPSEDDGHRDHGSLISCTDEENESLKTTVKKLSLQVEKQNEAIKKQEEAIKKQNEVISGMKSFMRNIGLSMATYFNDGEKEGNGGGGCRHGNNVESPANNSGSASNDSNLLDKPSGSDCPAAQGRVTVNTSEGEDFDTSLMTCCQDEKEDETLLRDTPDDQIHESPVIVDTCSKDCGPIVEDPLLIKNSDIFSNSHQQATPPDTQVSYSGESIVPIQGHSASKSSSSNEAGIHSCQNTDVDMDDDSVQDDDSSYVPDDSEDESESDKEMEDEHDYQESQVNARFIRNTDRRFGCSRCGKNYKSRSSLREHIRLQHSNSRPQFECNLCPKVFNSRKGVLEHISSIHKGFPHKCAHCPGMFCNRSHLLRHERSVHKKGGPPTVYNLRDSSREFGKSYTRSYGHDA